MRSWLKYCFKSEYVKFFMVVFWLTFISRPGLTNQNLRRITSSDQNVVHQRYLKYLKDNDLNSFRQEYLVQLSESGNSWALEVLKLEQQSVEDEPALPPVNTGLMIQQAVSGLKIKDQSRLHQQRIQHIDDIIRQQNYSEARQRLESLLNDDSEDYQALIRLAVIEAIEQNWIKSAELFSRVPGRILDQDTRFLKARACFFSGNLSIAESELKLLISANYREAWRLMGRLLIAKNQIDEALSLYQERLNDLSQAEDYDLEIALGAGEILLSKDRTREALLIFSDVVNRAPEDSRGYFNLSQTLVKTGQYQEAEKLIEAALRRDENNYIYQVLKGIILYNLSQFEQAISALNRSIRISPERSEAYDNLVNIYEKTDINMAAEVLERALKYHPDSVWFHYRLGLINLKLENYAGALDSFLTVRKLRSDYRPFEMAEVIGNIYWKLQDYSKAYQEFETARQNLSDQRMVEQERKFRRLVEAVQKERRNNEKL